MQLQFQDVIGHDTLRAFFARLGTEGSLPAALLLAGPPRVGKRALLEVLARQVLCAERTACGTCVSCLQTFSAHPDLVMWAPGAEAELRKTVATLLRRTHERPVLSGCLVVLLERIDTYSDPAHALLLKAIEDVSPVTHFFMTAERLEMVPATVRSRALVRTVAPLPCPALAHALTARGIPADRATTLAVLAGGRPGLALKLAADPALAEQYTRWYTILRRLTGLALAERAAFAEELDDRDLATEVLTVYQGMLRDNLRPERGGKAYLGNLPVVVRRSREALAMLRAFVPPPLALQYVFFTPFERVLRTHRTGQAPAAP